MGGGWQRTGKGKRCGWRQVKRGEEVARVMDDSQGQHDKAGVMGEWMTVRGRLWYS